MKLYNALTQDLETFSPRASDFSKTSDVSIYVCGITPYDTTHLGHVFTYASFDHLIRYLEFQGRTVRYVQNVTDIDDDVLRKAEQVGEDWRELGNSWTTHFIEDLRQLNVRPPDVFPRATEMIEDIIVAVRRLLDAGVAYEAAGNVYFHVDAWPGFGKLSHIPRAEMLPVANERGNVPGDPHKRDPLDFVLWQAQKPGEPAWPSPWGPGRPGWHIECSTMSTRFLGETIDLHGGGADLIFPHHECEIAQAECATGREPFVRFWLHTAMVYHEGEKMSKSLGNLVMVRDLLRTWTPDALRLYLSGHHYRETWSHDETELARAEARATQLLEAMVLQPPAGSEPAGGFLDPATAQATFIAAMDNDLDTPTAVGALLGLALAIEDGAREALDVSAAQSILRDMAAVFGLRLDAAGPEARVVEGWNNHLQRFE